MNPSYVVGHITVKNPEKWSEYRAKVPATLAPWHAELVFRGQQRQALAGELPYSDIVVIRFPDQNALQAWYASAAYQALIPLREEAADLILLGYES